MGKNIKIFVIIFLTTFLSCNTTEPPEDNRELTLTFEDASCTEAWITLTTENLQLPVDINLITTDPDGNPKSQILNLKSKDSLLYIDSLQPNQTYKFQVSGIGNQESGILSNELSFTTMDTTSHNFSFVSYQFGEHSSSVLYDVAIIGENNIWAVGEIYMNDSLGNPDPNVYNAMHWDGNQWTLKRISVLYNENLITPPLYGILVFSENEIWLSSGVPIKGDGNNWTQYHLFDMGVLNQSDGYLTKLWGSSSSDLYYVGTKGTIAHYNGNQWRKIESGTKTNLNDVWGYYNQAKNIKSVMTVASDILQMGEYRLIAISDNVAKDTLNWPYNHWLKGVWFKNEFSPVYVCGSGIRVYKNSTWEELDLPNYFTESIRGNDVNDIMTVGHYGIIMHFNGISWKVYNDFFPGDYIFSSVALKNNTAIIVGNTSSGGIAGQAIIVAGKR